MPNSPNNEMQQRQNDISITSESQHCLMEICKIRVSTWGAAFPSWQPRASQKSNSDVCVVFYPMFSIPSVHVHNTGKWIRDMSCQSIMPILATASALQHLKTCSGYLLTYIYLFVTGYVISILAINTTKIISISLWLVIMVSM